MNNYNELIGQLVEYKAESMNETTKRMEPNPVALGLIVETKAPLYEDPYIRIEWLVNPHEYTLFNISEINKFGLTLKDNEEWGV
jgi:hypothetical protein